ncbi:MAG: bifunctional glutamate--cysteine ligase GshA/glutathione synthetase GshB [Cellulosilyticum sp.]|nr:bifunctional glutamate--cysteine ligase GshA/glutathione synthetase GshB [Cellulosilyticum sp.]
MLEILRSRFEKEELMAACFGIERETLRVDLKGNLAMTKHPEVFGDKMEHPYITTDFSESQIELITPSLQTAQETYDFLNALYDMTALHIGDELLWPQSIPCHIPKDEEIPIAEYGENEKGQEARYYREKLLKKYGGQKQLISGIHYNFSFEEAFLERLYKETKSPLDYRDFKDGVYLKVVRQYLTYRWILIYLLGATPVAHETLLLDDTKLEKCTDLTYINDGAISHRNGNNGYKNDIDLYPDYTSTRTYLESLNRFVQDGSIQNYKELYSQIRPKAKDNTNLLNSLEKDGIQYVEIRSIDTNPFEKGGLSIEDLEFLHCFMLYLMIKEESPTRLSNWQEEANYNQRYIAEKGLLDIDLKREGKEIKKVDWALEILEEMLMLNEQLNLGKAEIIEKMMHKVRHPEQTYAYRILEMCKEEGYIQGHLNLAKAYKEDAYIHRYKLYGYEDMELSTQILMKEAILRGISVEVLDRFDNFIALKRGSHIEYVKQATKTSKDSYMTMLIMENKIVTKKILERNHIHVPNGIEVFKGQSLEVAARRYEGRAIVVKPKSTNFGKGISIFPQGANREDIIKALEIGFEHDDTVLIEEFAKGKEYRFLVIGDEVAGVLHRVPANVIGDGKKTIRQLVEIKNQDSLRGKGYKTPLEKINLDASSELFLKQSGLHFESIPKENEVVYLRENSNISTGGDSIDYTDEMPQRFKDIAVASAKAAGAKFCGVDMMLEDYTNAQGDYAIIEINFNPAIHIHSYPYKGTERRIAEKVLKVLGF